MENGTSQLGKILDESRQKEKLRDIGGCQRGVQTLLQLDHLPRYTTKLTKKKVLTYTDKQYTSNYNGLNLKTILTSKISTL